MQLTPYKENPTVRIASCLPLSVVMFTTLDQPSFAAGAREQTEAEMAQVLHLTGIAARYASRSRSVPTSLGTVLVQGGLTSQTYGSKLDELGYHQVAPVAITRVWPPVSVWL